MSRVIWRHCCNGDSCTKEEFDTKIKYLLQAHGEIEIDIDGEHDHSLKERGCNDCHYCEWAARNDMGGAFIVMRCHKDHSLEAIECDVSDLTGDLPLIQGRLFFESKQRATPCDHFKLTTKGLNKWVKDRR